MIAVGLLLVHAQLAGAQTVRGRIIDRNSSEPAPGVVVLLLDASERSVAQGLTDPKGEYRLTAAAPGSFRVRTLRIGYRPVTSAEFTLAAGQELTLAPLQAGARVILDTVHVVGRNSCRAVTGAAATFAIWEQARTALTAAQLTARARLISVRLVNFDRMLRRNHEVISQAASIRSGLTTRPWRSLPPDSLRRVGYVVLDEQNWYNYYGPDLDVLLSDQFLADHCFRLAPESDRTRIGIAFEPTRERGAIPEISGTLWLDRATSELRRLDYRYENIQREMEDAGAGGTMDFTRLANGAWTIARWSIRMPVPTRRFEAASGYKSVARVERVEVTQIKEEGGILTLVTQGRDTLWASVPLTIAGTVVDSGSNAPAANASVSLRGTPVTVRTDSTGRFRILDVLPGRYLVDFQTASLEALGATHTVPVTLIDSAASLRVRIPTGAQLGARLCRDDRGGIVAGTVLRPSDTLGARNVRVVAEYAEHQMHGNAIMERRRWMTAMSDERGKYRFCQVPIGREIIVRAESDSGNSAPVRVTIPENRHFAAVDLQLDRSVRRTAVLAGTVMSDVNGAPLADAQIVIPSIPRAAFTAEDGAFRLSGIPAGTYAVQVKKIGFRQVDLQVTLGENQTVDRRVLLSQVLMLDTVAVRAHALMASFDEHRKLGLGTFWTREQLAPQEVRRLSEVLDQTRGLQVVGGQGNAAWIQTRRGNRGGMDGQRSCFELQDARLSDQLTKSCGCFVQVYLDNIPLFAGRQGDEVPNINQIPVTAIEAIEYYAGPASTPAKYATLNSHCGVLVIHTRKTP